MGRTGDWLISIREKSWSIHFTAHAPKLRPHSGGQLQSRMNGHGTP